MRLNPLDILFSQYVRQRAIQRVGGCERCLTPKRDLVKDNGSIFPDWKQLQCSHFIGRGRRSVRWDEDNAAGLCAACHMYLGAHPLEHTRWFFGQLGENKIDLLLARNRQRVRPDENAITLYLKTRLRALD